MTMSNNVDDYASPRHDYESPKFVTLSIGIVDGQDFNLGSHAGSVRIHRHS